MLREPLLHFFVLGAVLFALYAWLRGPSEAPERIHVDAARVEQLALGFARTWQRPPTREELTGLVEDFVREEVLYREALAMELDRDDTIVRRRMRQKLEFLSEDLAPIPDPDDVTLSRYLAEHAERYRLEPRLALRQVFVSRERRGEAALTDANALLARLTTDPESDVTGDPTLLPAALPLSPVSEIAGVFGDGLAAALLELAPGRWSGPLESGYGLHLVLLEAREEGRMPELAEVRAAVANDWQRDERERANEAFYRELRGRYEVTIEPLVAEAAEAPARTAAQ